jgi:hypothetical protein
MRYRILVSPRLTAAPRYIPVAFISEFGKIIILIFKLSNELIIKNLSAI